MCTLPPKLTRKRCRCASANRPELRCTPLPDSHISPKMALLVHQCSGEHLRLGLIQIRQLYPLSLLSQSPKASVTRDFWSRPPVTRIIKPQHSGLIRFEMWPKLITYRLLKLCQYDFNTNLYLTMTVSTSCSEKEFDLSAGVSEQGQARKKFLRFLNCDSCHF